MTNTQLYLAIGVPLLVNTALSLFMWSALSTRIDALDRQMNQRFSDFQRHLVELWRAELHRVEEVLDARLKHLEEDRRR
jgi:hypothetical protein